MILTNFRCRKNFKNFLNWSSNFKIFQPFQNFDLRELWTFRHNKFCYQQANNNNKNKKRNILNKKDVYKRLWRGGLREGCGEGYERISWRKRHPRCPPRCYHNTYPVINDTRSWYSWSFTKILKFSDRKKEQGS